MSKGNYFKSSKAIFNVQRACKKTGLLLLSCNIKHVYGEGGGLQTNLIQRSSDSLINLTLGCNTSSVTRTHRGGTKLLLFN